MGVSHIADCVVWILCNVLAGHAAFELETFLPNSFCIYSKCIRDVNIVLLIVQHYFYKTKNTVYL